MSTSLPRDRTRTNESTTESSFSKNRGLEIPSTEWNIVWRNVILMLYVHLAGIYGLYLGMVSHRMLILYGIVFGHICGLGVTGGAHRLWSHRTYKARWPLRLGLMILHSMAFQESILQWVRNHRVHHKFTDTDADPHNSKRGFFFSHVGWLLIRKHPDVKEKGKAIDTSDIEKDPIAAWQHKYFVIFGPLMCFVIPTLVTWYVLGESLWVSWHCGTLFRYIYSLNNTWLVNSAAHMWGSKPYDSSISPSENVVVSILANGEGWHNYHHVFPWDYKTAELGNYDTNLTTGLIDFCASLGLAYDLRTVSPEVIEKRAMRTGDGSWIDHHDHSKEKPIWGWGDPDMRLDDVKNSYLIQSRLT